MLCFLFLRAEMTKILKGTQALAGETVTPSVHRRLQRALKIGVKLLESNLAIWIPGTCQRLRMSFK